MAARARREIQQHAGSAARNGEPSRVPGRASLHGARVSHAISALALCEAPARWVREPAIRVGAGDAVATVLRAFGARSGRRATATARSWWRSWRKAPAHRVREPALWIGAADAVVAVLGAFVAERE